VKCYFIASQNLANYVYYQAVSSCNKDGAIACFLGNLGTIPSLIPLLDIMTSVAAIGRNQVPQLPGYTVVEQVYLGSRTAVYRAVHAETQQSVVLKVLQRDYPSFSELVQFRNQYAITKNLPIAGIVQPLSLEPIGSSYVLVMEDDQGISLSKYIQHHTLELGEILVIAIQLADILHDLSQHRIVHKDIKPANILIQPESKRIKLFDFSIASLLPKETQEIQSPDVLEGTLDYLAPEQTGRMNRGIDYRADFYALGVTLYQLLTGRLPFSSNDPLELMHSHIAKVPEPVHQVNPKVPEMVARIVAKLMAKNAEDRYQSALGLKHDLAECLTQWHSGGTIAPFELGQHDFSDRFVIPEKLYGRDKEIATLLNAFERVSRGHTEMVLIAGVSGIGKTVVVNEVHKPMTRQKGYFIKGKFDQFNRDIPLFAFVQALRDLITQLLAESDEKLAQWRTQILSALEENGQILIDLVPDLEQIIGKQPIAPELSGSATQNRFNNLLKKFIEVFTTADHPLVLFLDDLQWADSASLQLVKLLMNDHSYLLLIGAYRDSEVSPTHPFSLTIDDLKKTNKIIHTTTLAPLVFEHINNLVADALHCSSELAKPLSELIYRKTKGNPFFTRQFLKALYEGGQIRADRTQRCWVCDISQINQLSLTEDVVEFMALQLQKLPSTTQAALQLAACIGSQFDLATLAIVLEQSPTDAATALWTALQEGLIVPANQVYKFFQPEDTSQAILPQTAAPAYRFLHDRIQQAAYSLIPETHRATIHYRIGRLLLSHLSDTTQQERIFEIVGHLNPGTDLVAHPTERLELAQLNLLAARKAMSSIAYTAALSYLNEGIALLPENAWKDYYSLTLELHHNRLEAAYLCTQFDYLEEWCEEVMREATSVLDRVKAYEILVQVRVAQDRQLEAIQLGLEALSHLNVPLLSVDLNDPASLEQLPRLETFPVVSDMLNPAYCAALRILVTITPPVHHVKPELYPTVALTMLHLCMEHGHTTESAFVYGCYSVLVWAILSDFEVAYQACQIALQLLEHYPSKEIGCKVYMIFGVFIAACKEPGTASLQALRQSIQIGQDVGDSEHVSYSMMAEASFLPLLEEHLDSVFEKQTQYLSFLKNVQQRHALDYLKIWHSLVGRLTMITTPDTDLFIDELDSVDLFTHLSHNHNHQSLFTLHLAKTIWFYLMEQYDSAVAQASEAGKYVNSAFGFLIVVAQNFYLSLALLGQDLTDSELNQAEILSIVEQNQQRMRYWASCAPYNFQHKYDLVEAERYRVAGQIAQAIDLYDRAIAGARKNGYLQEEALANELAAKFYLNWGKEKIAQDYLTRAYYGYIHWGAKAKAQSLEQRYVILLAPIFQHQQTAISATDTVFAQQSPLALQTTSTSSSSSTSISTTLDISTVLKASQTLSSEIQFDKLLSTLLHTVLENAGASKGVLLLPRDQGWFVEAVASLNQAAQVQPVALCDSLEIPHALVNTVRRSLQPAVIVDATIHPTLAINPYVVQHQPKSMLCTPILHQGKLIAILYLENKIAAGAFTHDRVELLNILCAQAAISLENARLYSTMQANQRQLANLMGNLPGMVYSRANDAGWTMKFVSEGCFDLTGYTPEEMVGDQTISYAAIIHPDDAEVVDVAVQAALAQHSSFQIVYRITTKSGQEKWVWEQGCGVFEPDGKLVGLEGLILDITDRKAAESRVIEKSQELAQALHDLQSAQLQMVQSEKMASLGNLVAGVAHEINNPIGFLNGSITNAKDYVQDFLEHLALYQQHYPNAAAAIQDHAEEIDLEFLSEDLPKLLDSMQSASDRIKSISTSLRIFSRADREHKVSANLHEGLDSTLLILKYRLKANEHRPTIEVIKDYGDLPLIDCFPGQLNQVFMNILANAIDMFDEMAQAQSFDELEAHPQQITIRTTTHANQVEIQICDNGKGMTEAVKAKIFDYLFTTKGVGKGTGLGLAIARQIVVEKHGGSLDVQSELGRGTKFYIRLPIVS